MIDSDDSEDFNEGGEPSFDSDKEKPWWSEVVRDVTSLGMGTLFMTEEAVRNYLKEKKLPKDIAAALVDNMAKKKEDLYGRMAKEFGKVLARIDISKEVSRFLESHNVELKTSISFSPKHPDEPAPQSFEMKENEPDEPDDDDSDR